MPTAGHLGSDGKGSEKMESPGNFCGARKQKNLSVFRRFIASRSGGEPGGIGDEGVYRLKRWVWIAAVILLSVFLGTWLCFPVPLSPPCPKVLMFDGLEIQTQNNEPMARYWGQTIGVQGFFVNNVMGSWETSVGDDENSQLYQSARRFQVLYSKYGVTDNFIKTALYNEHDWKSPAAESRVVSNFRQAAHLAKYAGFRGLALDLEPYVKGWWNEDPALPDKLERAYVLGRRVGAAIVSEYPDASVIALPEILGLTCPPYQPDFCAVYVLSHRFWDGLIQAHFRQLIIATENSYNSVRPDMIADGTRKSYRDNLLSNGVDPETVPISPGIWPLGQTYTDKAARCTPAQFEERLRLAMKQKSPYVWIYGQGSAWEKDGPYGKGDVDPRFQEFVKVLQRVQGSCAGSQ